VSRLVARKGQDVLIRAMPEIRVPSPMLPADRGRWAATAIG
jgi:hypothetical protein